MAATPWPTDPSSDPTHGESCNALACRPAPANRRLTQANEEMGTDGLSRRANQLADIHHLAGLKSVLLGGPRV